MRNQYLTRSFCWSSHFFSISCSFLAFSFFDNNSSPWRFLSCASRCYTCQLSSIGIATIPLISVWLIRSPQITCWPFAELVRRILWLVVDETAICQINTYIIININCMHTRFNFFAFLLCSAISSSTFSLASCTTLCAYSNRSVSVRNLYATLTATVAISRCNEDLEYLQRHWLP